MTEIKPLEYDIVRSDILSKRIQKLQSLRRKYADICLNMYTKKDEGKKAFQNYCRAERLIQLCAISWFTKPTTNAKEKDNRD